MLERRLDRTASADSSVRKAVDEILRLVEKPAPIHRALMRLADRGGTVTVATTNFDRMLERAGRSLRPRPKTYSLAAIPRPTRRPEFSGVFHVHGALTNRADQASELVLTDQDFGDFYLRRRVVPDFIYDAARLYHLVLVGYSANDPPMRYLLNAVAADDIHFDDMKERYSFVGGSPVDGALLADWRARGITPIQYDDGNDHTQLHVGLERWAKLSPAKGPTHAVGAEIRRIAQGASAVASDSDRALFEHLFRRGDHRERMRLAEVARGVGADLGWLDAMLSVFRERGGEVRG